MAFPHLLSMAFFLVSYTYPYSTTSVNLYHTSLLSREAQRGVSPLKTTSPSPLKERGIKGVR